MPPVSLTSHALKASGVDSGVGSAVGSTEAGGASVGAVVGAVVAPPPPQAAKTNDAAPRRATSRVLVRKVCSSSCCGGEPNWSRSAEFHGARCVRPLPVTGRGSLRPVTTGTRAAVVSMHGSGARVQ